MNISFSTTEKHYAEDYLGRDCFSWLNTKQKEYILSNLGDIRIQNPMMYPNPRLEIHNNGIKNQEEIMRLKGFL